MMCRNVTTKTHNQTTQSKSLRHAHTKNVLNMLISFKFEFDLKSHYKLQDTVNIST